MTLAELRAKVQAEDNPDITLAAHAALDAIDAHEWQDAIHYLVAAAAQDIDYAEGIITVGNARRGAKGAQTKSKKRAEASRANGRKGGRPKKTQPKE